MNGRRRTRTTSPATTPTVPPAPPPPQQQHAQQAQRDRRGRVDYIGFGFSIVALVVSAASAGFAWWQAEITRDSAQRQLRAYVHPTPYLLGGADGFAVGKTTTIGAEFRNGGATPAYEANLALWVAVLGLPAKSRVADLGAGDIKKATEGPSWGDYAYASKTLVFTVDRKPLTSAEHDAIVNERMRLFVWGRAEYKDTFGKPHHVNYCWSLGGRDLTQFLQCVDGNDID